MNGAGTLKFLFTANVLLLAALGVSVLTEGQPANAQTQVGRYRYAMVAGEQRQLRRTGIQTDTVYVADLEQGLLVALDYSRGLRPVAVRSMTRDIDASQTRR
jgi:hypothetical protein